MDYETAKLLYNARVVVSSAEQNAVMYAVLLVALIAGLVLYWMYILERWSWLPRKRHNRVFIERF